MHDLAVALASAGHDVTYLTMRHWVDAPPEIEGVKVVALVPAGTVYAEERRSLGPPARFGLAVARYLLRHGHRFDVVHTAAFPFFPMLAAGLARRRYRYRLIADWYEVWSRAYWQRYAGRLVGTVGWLVQRRCVHLRHRAFCISRLTERRLLEEGFVGEHTVLPGLYAGTVRPSAGRVVDPVVVYAGRHVPEKRSPIARRGASQLPVARYPYSGSRSTATARTGSGPSVRRYASTSPMRSSSSEDGPRKRWRTHSRERRASRAHPNARGTDSSSSKLRRAGRRVWWSRDEKTRPLSSS